MTIPPTTDHIPQLAAWAKDECLAVLTGAGVSMLAPSSLPSWWRLNIDQYRAFAHGDPELESYSAEIESLPLPPAVLAQYLWELLGDDHYPHSLAVLRGGKPNRNHQAIAALARAGLLADVVTLNFDQLHERALAEAGVAYRVNVDSFDRSVDIDRRSICVSKLHGSIEQPRSILATLDQTTREEGIGPSRKAALREVRERRHLLVLGYSGGDFFLDPDYLGLLSQPCDTKLIWNMRPGEVANSDHPLARLSHRRPEIIMCEGVLPDVLDRLAEACDVPVGGGSRLDDAPVNDTAWTPPGGAWAGHLFSKVFRHVGAFDKELACYRWEARQSLSYPGPHRAAWAIEGLAVWYLAHGHRDLARAFLTGLDQLLEVTGDNYARHRVRQAMGQLCRRYPPRSPQRDAQARHLLALAEESRDVSVLNDVGLVQYESEDHAAAIATFEKALALTGGGATALRAVVHGNLALAQTKDGDVESALQNFTRALDIEVAIGNREGTVHQLRQLGQLHLEQKNPEAAVPLLQRAANLAPGVVSAYKLAETLGLLGDALLATGRNDAARAAYEQALRAVRESDTRAGTYLEDFVLGKLAQLHQQRS